MKVAILQCDNVLDKFQKDFGNYPNMIIDLLMSIDHTLEIETFDVQQGDYPQDIEEWDLFITTGSKASVNDDQDWIQTLILFVKKLEAARKKLVGICFGHQIIALAKGGVVQKSDKGWGIGVATNRILKQRSWMTEPIDTLNLIVSHQDQITVLPDEACVIAESDFCPYFVVDWNNLFLSVQGHPEWQRAYSRTLINDRRTIIPSERVEQGLASLSEEPDSRLFAQWILNFARN